MGGHKRAHYYAGSFETVQEEEGATLVQREHSDVLDIFYLNLHTLLKKVVGSRLGALDFRGGGTHHEHESVLGGVTSK